MMTITDRDPGDEQTPAPTASAPRHEHEWRAGRDAMPIRVRFVGGLPGISGLSGHWVAEYYAVRLSTGKREWMRWPDGSHFLVAEIARLAGLVRPGDAS